MKMSEDVSVSVSVSVIGTHIPLDGSIYNSLLCFYTKPEYYKTSIQVFSGSPKVYKRSTNFLKEAFEFVKQNNLHIYVHGAYIVNLGRKSSEIDKAMCYLKKDLQIVKDIGSMGLVIHVGKFLLQNQKDSENIMYDNIFKILEDTPDSGKFLLETPSGSGTELLTDVTDFIDFCLKFKGNDRFGIVVDTCHVFASGYDPMEYIQEIYDRGLQIDLIHLNDSKGQRGSNVDRHAAAGEGHIGLDKLQEVILFCLINKIDMVTEY